MMSDTHGLHEKVDVPEGDILLHAGDLTNRGLLPEVSEFNRWIGTLPHRHKVVIAGNHDLPFERWPDVSRGLLTNCHYLQDEEIEIEGLRIYGSPWQPEFFNWAFNLKRGRRLAEKWAKIPEGIDILMTHGPPHGILDRTEEGQWVGCKDLRVRVEFIKPAFHLFGHIHEAYGALGPGVDGGSTTFVNASIHQHLTGKIAKCWVFDFDKGE